MQGYSFQADLTHRREDMTALSACIVGLRTARPADLQRLRGLADDHAVLALLRERVLSALADDDPARPSLRDDALREAARETRRNARLACALEALADAGVPALVFKGSALAHSHYARPDLRTRDDTDLLLCEAHLATAHTVLNRQGFTRMPGMQGSLIVRQSLYRHVDGDGLLHDLDVHWGVTNDPRAHRPGARALLARSRPLEALSPRARAPADDDALLLACLHLDAHHAGDVRLIWLHDVHLLVTRMSLQQRERAATRAMQKGLADACRWVLEATWHVFATPLDGFGTVLASANGTPPSPGRAGRWLRDLSRLADSTERLRWLSQHLFPPVGYLRHRFASDGPAWQLYLRRALNGVGHFTKRP